MLLFISGLASGMILLLVAQRIKNAYSNRESRKAYIEQVARLYHDLSISSEKGKPAPQVFISAGAARFENKQDLDSAREIILQQGGLDPLIWVKDELSDSEVLPFLKWQAGQVCTFQEYQNKEYFRKYVDSFRKQRKV